MIWDRLGVISDEVSQDLVVALDWAVEYGLKHVEIRMVDGVNVLRLTEEQIERVQQEVQQRGLFVSALASPLFKCPLDPTRPLPTGDLFGCEEQDVEEHHRMVHKAIDYAKRLKTNYIRIFSFWREEQPELYMDDIVRHLKLAAEAALEGGIVLLLENGRSCNGGFSWEVADIVRKVDSPALKVLWDPGNEDRTSPSYPQGYEHVRDQIAHFHLKHSYVANGPEPLLPQLQALRRDGYDGLITIETHYIPQGGTPMDGTRETVELLRELLKEDSVS